MKKIQKLANDYAKKQGDDCLCGRNTPGTPFGECIYVFCGCNIAEAFEAGFRKAREMCAELSLMPAPYESSDRLEVSVCDVLGIGEEYI